MADRHGSVTGGVDTHKDTNVAAVVDSAGRVLGTESFPTTASGHRRLLAWMRGHGDVGRIGVEGTGSYGAGLARHLAGEGIDVVEVNRPNRRARRRRGKNDVVDAEAAARAALNGEAAGAPKAGDGIVESIRALRVAFCSTRNTRTRVANQIRDLVVTAPDELRAGLEPLDTAGRVERCSRLRPGDLGDAVEGTKAAMRALARQHQALTTQLEELRGHLDVLTNRANGALREAKGVGADVASILLVAAGDNPGRLADEASFAALCGASPVEASSGKVVRHRLNRGGNRQANHALWRVVMVRLASDPRTKAYAARRRAEGRTTREIVRCLKRYVARELYALLVRPAPTRGPGRLRTARLDAGLSLATVAHDLGTWPARISELERGVTRNDELERRYRRLLTAQIA